MTTFDEDPSRHGWTWLGAEVVKRAFFSGNIQEAPTFERMEP
jgi:hypothetical protein